MEIKVIGAGFGRTGTLSLKSALEVLGLGPCYHMMEVIERPGHSDVWYRISRDGKVDWTIFEGYQSIVDWPAVRYWREIVEHYPSAKVVLSTRDAASWYKSAYETIYQRLIMPLPADAPEERRLHRAMSKKVVLEDTFGGRFEDKRHAIDVFERHNAAVREAIDPSRLLIYSVKEGWEPLCRFLDLPIPEETFPRLNDTASFLAWTSEADEATS